MVLLIAGKVNVELVCMESVLDVVLGSFHGDEAYPLGYLAYHEDHVAYHGKNPGDCMDYMETLEHPVKVGIRMVQPAVLGTVLVELVVEFLKVLKEFSVDQVQRYEVEICELLPHCCELEPLLLELLLCRVTELPDRLVEHHSDFLFLLVVCSSEIRTKEME